MTRRLALPSLFQITISVLLGLAAIWALGFIVFFGIVAGQKTENADGVADLAVVLTGGTGRVEAGFEILTKGHAKALLISGVHPDVTLQNLLDLWDAPQAEKDTISKHCCITIGHMADDTESNASETAAYIKGKNVQSIRIVTSNYHMPRAWILFKRTLPDAAFTAWPVAGNGPLSATFWRNLFIEYSKTLLTWLA